MLLVPWSCLGYPAITVNGGLSADGLPLGLQLVGAPMAEFTDTAALLRELSSLGVDDEPSAPSPSTPAPRVPSARPPVQDAKKKKRGLFGR